MFPRCLRWPGIDQQLSNLPAHDLVFHIFHSKRMMARRWERSPVNLNIFILPPAVSQWNAHNKEKDNALRSAARFSHSPLEWVSATSARHPGLLFTKLFRIFSEHVRRSSEWSSRDCVPLYTTYTIGFARIVVLSLRWSVDEESKINGIYYEFQVTCCPETLERASGLPFKSKDGFQSKLFQRCFQPRFILVCACCDNSFPWWHIQSTACPLITLSPAVQALLRIAGRSCVKAQLVHSRASLGSRPLKRASGTQATVAPAFNSHDH